MLTVTESYPDSAELEDCAWVIYEKFRPQIRQGTAGWGQKSAMHLQTIIEQARR